MLRRRTTRPRRVLRKRKAMRKRIGRPRRALNANKQDRAVVVETQELTATPEGGNYVTHTLAQYNRALAVSKNFRFYRCKKVEVMFIPYANVFAPGSAFPELYIQVDRTQGATLPGVPLPLPTKNMMLARGVMPIKWTKPVLKSYVPSVARQENLVYNTLGNNVQDLGSITITPVKYKWYATQQYYPNQGGGNAAHFGYGTWGPQALQYFGLTYFINQDLAPPSAVLGTIKVRVHWEFKQPLWTSDVSATPITDGSGNIVVLPGNSV